MKEALLREPSTVEPTFSATWHVVHYHHEDAMPQHNWQRSMFCN